MTSISFIIPAYNASKTIRRSINSVLTPYTRESTSFDIEIIVIDDGSNDSKELQAAVLNDFNITFLSHKTNRGVIAARNTGISASKGDIIVLLDADDEMVSSWPYVLEQIINEWPKSAPICFTACVNQDGKSTTHQPDYTGRLTAKDIILKTYSGEYMTLFQGPFIRENLMIDIGKKAAFENITYISIAKKHPLWISKNVLRIYYDSVENSISNAHMTPQKAQTMVHGYKKLLDMHGDLIQSISPQIKLSTTLKMISYIALSGKNGAFKLWWKHHSFQTNPVETIGCLLIIILGPTLGSYLPRLTRKFGLTKKYG